MRSWQAYDARMERPGPFHERVDHADGTKSVRWRATTGYGLGEHRLKDLIYADRMPLPRSVVVTEGERACDAVRAAGLDAVGTVCGAGATPGPAVIALFADVHVALWPDADAVGFDHMARLARRLEPVVASMALVEAPPGAAQGWDAADATPRQIRVLVALARDIWLDRTPAA